MISDSASFQIYDAKGTRQNSVARAIQAASAKTGVDFNYLVKQAKVESSMNPNAKAKTSSATGLYQFIDQTWLREMKAHGAEHGYATYANAIKQTSNGDYYVPNASTKRTILNLRKDPQASSMMAAELASDNNDYLKEATGSTPRSTDLYMAHFLGAQGAANFLTSMKKNPWAPASEFFPEAAHANKSVFYAQGRPLSLQQVYNNFDAKFSGSSADSSPVQTASGLDLDHTDQGPSPVILPSAITWNNPYVANDPAQQVLADVNNDSDVRALTNDASETPAQTSTFSGFGKRIHLAQASMQYLHDDESRYNS